jgi:hypothetical protein
MGFEAKNYPQISQITRIKLKAEGSRLKVVRRLPQLNPLRSISAKYLTGQAQITQINKLIGS